MSTKTSTTDLTLKVADNESGTHVQTQYGVRLPDGTHQWGAVEGGGRRVNIQGLLDPKVKEADRALWLQHWHDYIKAKAVLASLNPDDYEEMHQFVKRTLVLAVTDIEEL